MRCVVNDCGNSTRKTGKIRFYCFPKDTILLPKWISFCRRKDNFNTKHARICSAHFTSNDFQRNIQFEMGLCSRTGYKLKPETVPTIYSNCGVAPDDTREELSSNTEARKIMIAALLEESNDVPPMSIPNDSNQEIKFEKSNGSLADKIKLLEKEVKKLKQENFILKKAGQKTDNVLKLLHKQLLKCEFEQNHMNAKLRRMFTAGQVKKLRNGTKRQKWTEEDITESIPLYFASPKAYIMLRRKHFPLPAVRTIQNWIQKEVLEPVVEMSPPDSIPLEEYILDIDEIKEETVIDTIYDVTEL